MRRARSNGSRRCAASSSIRRSPSTMGASSRLPATACWWNLPASSMRCAARSRCSRRCPSATPASRRTDRIELRIGINLGDVIVEGDDIIGDGVNIAARMEALAEPAGCSSRNTVHDQVRDRLPYAFEDLGEQQVKNIARPVRVYALSAAAVAALPPVIGADGYRAMPVAPMAAPSLSIVVLPFANLSNDPGAGVFRRRDNRGFDDRSVADCG